MAPRAHRLNQAAEAEQESEASQASASAQLAGRGKEVGATANQVRHGAKNRDWGLPGQGHANTLSSEQCVAGPCSSVPKGSLPPGSAHRTKCLEPAAQNAPDEQHLQVLRHAHAVAHIRHMEGAHHCRRAGEGRIGRGKHGNKLQRGPRGSGTLCKQCSKRRDDTAAGGACPSESCTAQHMQAVQRPPHSPLP